MSQKFISSLCSSIRVSLFFVHTTVWFFSPSHSPLSSDVVNSFVAYIVRCTFRQNCWFGFDETNHTGNVPSYSNFHISTLFSFDFSFFSFCLPSLSFSLYFSFCVVCHFCSCHLHHPPHTSIILPSVRSDPTERTMSSDVRMNESNLGDLKSYADVSIVRRLRSFSKRFRLAIDKIYFYRKNINARSKVQLAINESCGGASMQTKQMIFFYCNS